MAVFFLFAPTVEQFQQRSTESYEGDKCSGYRNDAAMENGVQYF